MIELQQKEVTIRITENSLAETAAAAIKQRMTVLNNAREFCPLGPSSRRDIAGSDCMAPEAYKIRVLRFARQLFDSWMSLELRAFGSSNLR